MANVVGMLEIQMAADLARLSKDMSSAQATVTRTVSNINNILGTIGVGLSVDMFASMIKGVVDAGDRLNDLRKISSLTVEELGGLGKAAKLNGSNLEDVAKAIGIMNGNVAKGSDAFARLSISTKTASGDFRQSRDILLDVADRFSTMRDGVQKAAIAQEIFGKSGRELIPLLNEGRQAIEGQMEAYAQSGSMTTRLAEQSDQFNDILTVLNGNVTATKNNFVSGLLPALIDIGNAFTQATGSATLFSSIGQGIGVVLKGIVIAVATAAGTIKSLGIAIDGIARQFIAITNLDFSKAMQIGDRYFKSIDNNAKGTAEFIKTIVNGDQQIEQATKGQQKLIDLQERMPTATGAAIKAVQKQNKEYNIQLYLLRQYEEEAKRARDITESVATEQEIYNKKLEELNRLKPYLTVETYDRALAKLAGTTKQVSVSTKNTTDEISQLWMQAGRNIQSSLADGIFNFFDNGLKGMVKSVISTVGRIMSEFAALKIAQSVGLSSMFSGGIGGSGGKSGIGGIGNALSLANLGTSAASLVKGGFGLNSLAGGGLSAIGGSGLLGSFGAGMSGGGAAASFIAAESATAGAGLAAGMGASFAAAAGPLMIAAAATAGLKALAGDKRLGGGFGNVMNKIGDMPIIGDLLPVIPLINALFGRGPLKQKETTLSGSIGQGGFESGSINTNFVAKGGLFRSNKNDFARVDAVTGQVTTDNDKLQAFADSLGKQSRDIIDLFNETATGVSGSLKDIGKNLGISTDSLNSFNREINLVSEKGKFLTEEQISAEIAAITDQMITGFLPAITDLAKRGETSAQAIQRINGEFNSLTIGAQNLGMSVQSARDLIMSMSIEARTAFVDQAGGIEKIAQETSFFFQNFLSESEQLALKTGNLSKALIDLGLSADLTRDQFAQMIMSTGTANDLKLSLLELAPAFDEVRKSAATITQSLGLSLNDQATNALARLQKSIDSEKTKLTDKYNLAVIESERRIKDVSDTIAKLSDVSAALKSSVNSINPLSLEQARSQVMSGRSDSSNVKDSIAILGQQQSETGFSNVLDFKRSTAANVNLLNSMATKVDREMLLAQRSLAALEASRKSLDSGFKEQVTRLDQILEDARNQTSALQGIDTRVLSVVTAIGELNRILTQGGREAVSVNNGVGKDPVKPMSGNPAVSTADLVRFIDKNKDNPMAIYRAAVKHGVSSGQIAATGIVTQTQIDDWVKQNNLASFDVGGKVPRTGLAMIHKNEQVLTENESSNMSGQIEQLTKAVEVLTIANNKMNRRFDKWDSEGLPAERTA